MKIDGLGPKILVEVDGLGPLATDPWGPQVYTASGCGMFYCYCRSIFVFIADSHYVVTIFASILYPTILCSGSFSNPIVCVPGL